MKSKYLFWKTVLLVGTVLNLVSYSLGLSEKRGDCSIIAGNGSIPVLSDNNCTVYTIRTENKSSIISVQLYKDAVVPSVSSEDSNLEVKNNIVIVFKEYTSFKNGTQTDIVTKQWTVTTEQSVQKENIYYSRTSHLEVHISVNGSWSGVAFQLHYEEVPYIYETFDVGFGESSGEITPPRKGSRYRPNCVSLFRIKKSKDMKVNSIDVVLDFLDIDSGIGEYLLIGAGHYPFEGPPPLFVFSNNTMRKYKINDENAYILFVANSARTNRKGFRITWQHNGTKISEDKNKLIDDRRDDVLQSVQVCIYNIEAALSEFNQSNYPFKEFRERIAEISTQYAKNYSLETKYVNWTKVQIYRVSGVIPKDSEKEDLKDGGLYVMLKMQGSDEGTAAFLWHQLDEIVNHYTIIYGPEHTDSEKTDGYKIGRCPKQSYSNKWINVGLYAMIPILCCLFVVMLLWKQKTIPELLKKKMKILTSTSAQHAKGISVEGNIYFSNPQANTAPKMLLTNDRGRQYTFNCEEMVSSCIECDSDIEIFNKQDFIKAQRQASIQLESRSARSSTRISVKKPEVNAAFEDDEECILSSNQGAGPRSQTAEHFYDSVRSSKSDGKKEIEDTDTRL